MSTLRATTSFLTRSAFFTAKGYAVRAIKHGREFRRFLDELEESQWYPADRLRDLQDRKLRALVEHAYNNVPYYRSLFDRHALTPSRIRSVDDLSKIPMLTKADIRANARDLVARTMPARMLFPGWTTGSTGTPINVLRTHAGIAFEHATLWRQRRWAGIARSERNAAVWGTVWNNVILRASAIAGPPYWRYNAADRQMLFSYYHMSDRTLPSYLKQLEEFRPVCLEGFPSTLLILAQALKKRGSTIPMKAVFTSSEPLFAAHREVIEAAFETKIFDLYGQAERVACATECDCHNGLHVNPEYGVFEVLHDGREARPGESGEIVGTGLNNVAMPLLRYRTGDVACVSPGPCECGRAMPLLERIEGRQADVIVTHDGRRIPGDGIMWAFHGIENIERCQVVQETRSSLVVKIVPENPSGTVDTGRIRRSLLECLGSGMDIRFTLTPADGPEHHVGKFRWVMSLVEGTGPESAQPAGAPERSTLVVGVVDVRQAGGVYAAEHAFLEALVRQERVRVVPVPFGSRARERGVIGKAVRLTMDLLVFGRALRRERPDLIHLNSAFNRQTLVRDTLYTIVARAAGARLFLKFHGSDVRVLRARFWRWLARKLVERCDGIGVLSTEEKEHFRVAGCRVERLFVVKNAVDVARFSAARNVRRAANRLLFIGRFIPPKGLIETIAALRVLTDQGRDLELVCVGDGPLMSAARQTVERLGLDGRVRFTGFVQEEETTALYAGAGMLVFPTYHQEGFPMTLFHAMAAGLPVVTTRIRAAADYLREPDHCLWVEPRNPSMLAERIGRLLDDPRLCAAMGRNNRILAASFEPCRVARDYAALYNRLRTGENPALPQAPPEILAKWPTAGHVS